MATKVQNNSDNLLLEMSKRLESIQVTQDLQSRKIDAIQKTQGTQSKKLDGIQETQEDHTKRLQALSGDMEQVLSELKATHDEIGLWHQRDKREIDQIKKHVRLPVISDIPE